MKAAFIVFAVLSGITAIYHFVGIFYKVNGSPVWRHILFIFISLICMYGSLKRPGWFIGFFFLLLLQQLYSHGSDIAWHWRHEHMVDWISMGIMIVMPLVFILLLKDKRARLPASGV